MVSCEGIFTSSRFSTTTQFSDTWHEVPQSKDWERERERERERGHSVSRPDEGWDEVEKRTLCGKAERRGQTARGFSDTEENLLFRGLGGVKGRDKERKGEGDRHRGSKRKRERERERDRERGPYSRNEFHAKENRRENAFGVVSRTWPAFRPSSLPPLLRPPLSIPRLSLPSTLPLILSLSLALSLSV